MLGHPRSKDPHTLQWCTVMSGRTVRVPHAIVMPPALGDETRNVGPLAGAKTNATTIVPANIVGQSLTILANAVDPHALT